MIFYIVIHKSSCSLTTLAYFWLTGTGFRLPSLHLLSTPRLCCFIKCKLLCSTLWAIISFLCGGSSLRYMRTLVGLTMRSTGDTCSRHSCRPRWLHPWQALSQILEQLLDVDACLCTSLDEKYSKLLGQSLALLSIHLSLFGLIDFVSH